GLSRDGGGHHHRRHHALSILLLRRAAWRRDRRDVAAVFPYNSQVMNRNRLILIVLILLVVGIGGWLYLRSGRENVAVDLVQTFPTAKIRRPGPEAFSVMDAKINGESKRAIFTKDN